MDIQEKNQLFEQFKKTKTFKCFYSTLLQFDESLNCFVATEKWRNKEAELLTSAWWMFEEMQAAKAQAVPEGFVLIKDDTKTVVAIERMVEQQVEASGMDSRRLERLDGWKIIEAAVKAQEPAND